MTPLCIFLALLCKTCQVLSVDKTSSLSQDSGVKTAQVGDSVTLQCSSRDDTITFFSWYQQTLGSKPHVILSRMSRSSEADIKPAFRGRFDVFTQSQNGINNLIITNLQLLDSATYYCGVSVFNTIEFGQGVFLHVKRPSNLRAAVHQSALEPVRLGDSLNLSCTVYAEPCVGEQSVYWFRHGESQPAVVYPSAGQCAEEPRGKNCTSRLAIPSVNSSDAGTYYCALASCGEVVFGKGTRVAIEGPTKAPPLLAYCLSAALAVSITMLLVLTFITYKLKKKLCSVCTGTVSHLTCSAPSDAASQDADSLHYAALSLRNNERHRPDVNMESVCIYSSVKSRK